MKPDNIDSLRKEIMNLKAELAEREASIPAHSVRPHQLQAIEELEDRINEKEMELNRLAQSAGMEDDEEGPHA